MAEVAAVLSELSTHADIGDSEDLLVLALGASGHRPDDPLDVIDPIGPMSDGPLPGDLLVRRAPAEGLTYLAVIVGDHVETADALAARGVKVEAAGPGMYVEVAEVPFGGGAVQFSARQISDRWGRNPRGQTIYRPRPAPGYDDDGEGLFESEELARHAVYGAGGVWAERPATLVQAGENGGRPTVLTTARLRQAWSSYECAEDKMTPLRLFGRWNTPVNPETVDAWRAFERALADRGLSAASGLGLQLPPHRRSADPLAARLWACHRHRPRRAGLQRQPPHTGWSGGSVLAGRYEGRTLP